MVHSTIDGILGLIKYINFVNAKYVGKGTAPHTTGIKL